MPNSCKRLISYLTYMIYIFFKSFLLQNKRKEFTYVAYNVSPCCIIAVLYQLSLLLVLKEKIYSSKPWNQKFCGLWKKRLTSIVSLQ